MLKRPLLLSTLLSSALLCSSALYAAEVDLSKPLAVVNGKTLTEQDYQNFAEIVQSQTSRPIPPEQREQAIDEIISRELMAQNALKDGLDKNPEFQKRLDKARYSLLVEFSIRDYIEKNPVSDEEVKKEYDERIKKITLPTEYKAKHVLLKTEEEAKAVIEELKKGADIAKLAEEKSEDKGSGKNGGDLGWFQKEQMVAPFSEAVAKMEKGKFSEAPVKSDFGWHVILLEDTRTSEPPAFDLVKERMLQSLQTHKVAEYLDEIKKNAKIERVAQPEEKAAEESAEKAEAPAK
jgi:peptidyl-prolyl cis-trans isomerase C